MKRIALSAAAALMLGTAAHADGHAAETYTGVIAEDFYATTLIGMRVYASEAEFANDMFTTGSNVDWDDIGEINDLIVSKDGTVKAAIIGVGGFLGVGERDVALTMDDIRVLTEENDSKDRFLVVNYTAEQLEAAAAFERKQTVDVEQTTEVAPEATDTDSALADRTLLEAPMIERDGYAAVEIEQLTAADLQGSYVYGSNDESVGEVGELLLTNDGKIDRAVINVGGFLGIGEKPVAVTMQELTLMRDENGELRVYIDSTQEALEAQPTYEG